MIFRQGTQLSRVHDPTGSAWCFPTTDDITMVGATLTFRRPWLGITILIRSGKTTFRQGGGNDEGGLDDCSLGQGLSKVCGRVAGDDRGEIGR